MIGSEHVAHHVDFCYLEPKFYLLRNCFWVPTWIAGAHVLELPCAAFSRHIIRELDQSGSSLLHWYTQTSTHMGYPLYHNTSPNKSVGGGGNDSSLLLYANCCIVTNQL